MCVALLLLATLPITAAPTKDVNLAWEKSPDPSVTAYKVYDIQTGVRQPIALVGNTNLINITLPKNRTYTFIVTALNGTGESSPSNSVVLPR